MEWQDPCIFAYVWLHNWGVRDVLCLFRGNAVNWEVWLCFLGLWLTPLTLQRVLVEVRAGVASAGLLTFSTTMTSTWKCSRSCPTSHSPRSIRRSVRAGGSSAWPRGVTTWRKPSSRKKVWILWVFFFCTTPTHPYIALMGKDPGRPTPMFSWLLISWKAFKLSILSLVLCLFSWRAAFFLVETVQRADIFWFLYNEPLVPFLVITVTQSSLSS